MLVTVEWKWTKCLLYYSHSTIWYEHSLPHLLDDD